MSYGVRFRTGCLLVAVALVLVAVPGPAHSQTAPRGDHVDTYHGVRVPDPYRWMEQMEAEETRRWVEAQDRRARDFAGGFESRVALRNEVARLADVRRFRPPWKRGGRYFYLTYQSSGGPGMPGTQLHVREGLEGGGGADRILLSQEDLPEGTVLTRIVPGPHGRLVAYGVARDGSRWETLRVFDLERERPLDDRLEGVNGGASTVAWAPEGRGFYYERFDLTAEAEARTARLENERVLYHRVGTDQEEDRSVLAASAADRALTVWLGEGGRWTRGHRARSRLGRSPRARCRPAGGRWGDTWSWATWWTRARSGASSTWRAGGSARWICRDSDPCGAAFNRPSERRRRRRSTRSAGSPTRAPSTAWTWKRAGARSSHGPTSATTRTSS